MVVIRASINERGLDFTNQQKVVILRDKNKHLKNGKKPMSWNKIAEQVENLQGEPSCEDVVKRVYERFNKKQGRVTYKYALCGRKAWVLTPEVKREIISQLLKLRHKTICTSTTLQQVVFQKLGVKVSESHIRSFLSSKGYHWKSRSQKRKYARKIMKLRKKWTQALKDKSEEAIRKHVTFAMDGVVLTVPPADKVERHNFCWHGETHMWRKDNEAASPELAGDDPYAKQVPLSRAVPLWGAISGAGFRELTYHASKKLSIPEWQNQVLNSGALMKACRELQPGRHEGPRRILCDNETFIKAKVCRQFYKKKHIVLMPIPPKCPDLNPIEQFWGWLRRRLRLRDLEDLRKGRPVIGKTAYRVRVKAILRSKAAQNVAKAKFNRLKKVCQEVFLKKGAASRG